MCLWPATLDCAGQEQQPVLLRKLQLRLPLQAHPDQHPHLHLAVGPQLPRPRFPNGQPDRQPALRPSLPHHQARRRRLALWHPGEPCPSRRCSTAAAGGDSGCAVCSMPRGAAGARVAGWPRWCLKLAGPAGAAGDQGAARRGRACAGQHVRGGGCAVGPWRRHHHARTRQQHRARRASAVQRHRRPGM